VNYRLELDVNEIAVLLAALDFYIMRAGAHPDNNVTAKNMAYYVRTIRYGNG